MCIAKFYDVFAIKGTIVNRMFGSTLLGRLDEVFGKVHTLIVGDALVNERQ